MAIAPVIVDEEPGAAVREYRIARSDYEAVVKGELQRVMRWYFIEPNYNGNRFVGYRVKEVVNPALADGPLQPGDVLIEVNESSVERPDQAMAVWRGLWNRKTLKLKLLRDGQELVLDIPIVEEDLKEGIKEGK